MHVLFIPSWYENKTIPTLGSFFREQAEGLAKKDIKVTVAYPGFNSIKSIGRDMYGKSKYVKNDVYVYRDDSYNLFYDTLPIDIKSRLFKKKLLNLYKKIELERGKPDIIHIHSSVLAGHGGVYLAKKYSIPVLVTEHSSAFLQDNFNSDQRKLVKSALDESDCIVSVSNGLKDHILKYTNNEELRVIPNIVNIKKFNISPQKSSSNKFTFLTVCYLNNNKGLDILLKAFSRLSKQSEDINLVICGDGREKQNLINLSKELGIEEKVNFVGAVSRDEVNLQMNRANCFVLPSRFETFGVVLIEALACGLPIISTKTSGPSDIVTKDNGLLVNIDDVEQLSEAMNNIYENIEEYNSIKIRQSCIELYSESSITEKIIDLYKEIIKKRGHCSE